MIAFVRGVVYALHLDSVIVDVNGVGYEIRFNRVDELKLDSTVFLHTMMIVREDAQTLYGFSTIEEKRMFEQLINVKGIGPKTAMTMLSVASIDLLSQAILNEDVTYLKTLPQIGAKSASQIILDLKGKLVKEQMQQVNSANITDTMAALKQLGYRASELSGLPKYLVTLGDVDDQTLLKASLNWLLKQKKGV
ncbi:MAG: Holliday junction branch migration protein RuvA [Erysipelothrix sp.]|jgi:Holliday junction DNA helicase RuvA|nr:Holliday junction branch migration protein RuvA [Erysipelothrix sp.]